MAFSGNVASMSLDEVFNFLAANALQGELVIRSGDDVSLRLYFTEGLIFFPFSSRRGTYHLGKILRRTGILSRDGLSAYLDGLKEKKDALLAREDDDEAVREAKELQFTEEIHDLFLWGNARFEFRPGDWPPRVQGDYEGGRGLKIDTTSLLMEVAKRQDEVRRIRTFIPSSRFILRTREGADEQVVAGLKGLLPDLAASPFDGRLRLDDLLTDWGVPQHEALAAVALLVERGHLEPVEEEDTRKELRERLAGSDLLPAARLLGHWVELRRKRGERFSLELEQEFVTSSAFVSGPEEVTSLKLEGPRIFTLARVLVALGNPFTLVLHHRGWEKRIAMLPGEIYVRNERRPDDPTPPLRDYALKEGALDKEVHAALVSGEETKPLDELIESAQLQEARLDKLVDELAELVFWGRTEVELRNRSVRGQEEGALVASLPAHEDRRRLRKGLEAWTEVFDLVPGEDAIFVPGEQGEGGDPAARFFRRFDLTANVSELRRKAHATPLDFAQFVHRGLSRGYLRAPTLDELQAAAQEARDAKNDVALYRIALAGEALGHGEAFAADIEAVRLGETALPDSFPALEGDLDGVGLGALLQALRENRRTGTLAINAGKREEKLFFLRGEAFILRIEDTEADEFVNFFLGDDGADSMDLLGSGLASRGLVDESELTEAEATELKNDILDVLLWQGSTFSFFHNTLPDEFFNPGDNVSKIALNTSRFLMEAMQCMTEWEQIEEVIVATNKVFQFTTPEAKLVAIRDRGHPEILTLIDGRLCFDDLVRISGAQRLEVGRVISDLVNDGSLEITGEKVTHPDQIPDATPD